MENIFPPFQYLPLFPKFSPNSAQICGVLLSCEGLICQLASSTSNKNTDVFSFSLLEIG